MKKPKKSLRSAINQHCKNCIYDSIGGNGAWREQVQACTSYSCALFDVRPKSYSKPSVSINIELKSLKISKPAQNNEVIT